MSIDPEDIAARFWNLPQKGDEEERRESLFMDDTILKAHMDREIESRLDGVGNVLDAGAGSGRFSIPLAARGIRVTHLDISLPMIDRAREKAARLGVAHRIEFVVGRLADLAKYEARSFDLVISLDAPVSYVHPRHEDAILQIVRLARRAVILGVASRAGSLPYLFSPLQKKQYMVDPDSSDPLVRGYLRGDEESWQPDFERATRTLETGLIEPPDRAARAYEEGGAPWPTTYLFSVEELSTLLDQAGVHDLRFAGPGALSRSIPGSILRKLLLSEAYRGPFLDLCYRFDSQPSVAGMGKDNLVVSGRVAH